MDSRKYMLLINGQDKTDSVASFRFQDGMCEVVYTTSPKTYIAYTKNKGLADWPVPSLILADILPAPDTG